VRLPISPYPHLGCKNTVFLDYEENYLEFLWAVSSIAFGGICWACYSYGIYCVNMPSGIYTINTAFHITPALLHLLFMAALIVLCNSKGKTYFLQ
jgi:hypothetical protein